MRNRGCLWILGVVIAIAALLGSCFTGVVLGAAAVSDDTSFGGPAVAVIEVNGAISSGSDELSLFSTGGATSGRITKLLKQAANDPNVKAVVLRVDSPGGGVTASDEIYNEVVKTKAKKKVVVSMGSLAASGGYYISAPADRIFANPTSLTGSIGVISVVPDVSGLMEKVGVSSNVFKSGAHKDDSLGLRPLTDADKQIWQAMIDDSYARFVEVVAQGRGLEPGVVRQLADGRVYTGRQALAVKLVDEMGDLPEAVAAAGKLGGINGELRVVRYRSGGLLGALSESWLKPPWQAAFDSLAIDPRAPMQYRFVP